MTEKAFWTEKDQVDLINARNGAKTALKDYLRAPGLNEFPTTDRDKAERLSNQGVEYLNKVLKVHYAPLIQQKYSLESAPGLDFIAFEKQDGTVKEAAWLRVEGKAGVRYLPIASINHKMYAINNDGATFPIKIDEAQKYKRGEYTITPKRHMFVSTTAVNPEHPRSQTTDHLTNGPATLQFDHSLSTSDYQAVEKGDYAYSSHSHSPMAMGDQNAANLIPTEDGITLTIGDGLNSIDNFATTARMLCNQENGR